MKKIRILALVLALLLTASLAACAAKSSAPMAYDNTASAADNYKTEAASEEMPAEAPAMAESESEWAENSITTQSYAGQDDAASDAPTESLADKMIYSANLEIQTTEYDAAVAALEKAVQDFGGFVERSNTYGDIRRNDDGTRQVVNRYADYTVRIPMSHGVDSLNGAAASAVAFWQLRAR